MHRARFALVLLLALAATGGVVQAELSAPETAATGPAASAPAANVPAAGSACADPEAFVLGLEGLGAEPAKHHKPDPTPIVCNEQCDDWYDDCSAYCEPDQSSMCTGLALASGWCFFCDCW